MSEQLYYHRPFSTQAVEEKNYVAVLSKEDFFKSIKEHRTRIRKIKEQFLLELPLFQKFRKRTIAEEFVDNVKSKVFKRGDFIIKEKALFFGCRVLV